MITVLALPGRLRPNAKRWTKIGGHEDLRRDQSEWRYRHRPLRAAGQQLHERSRAPSSSSSASGPILKRYDRPLWPTSELERPRGEGLGLRILADLDRLYAAVKAERGTLDVVFANAGAGSQLPLGKITAEHIDEIFDTNVKGSIFTVQKALPLMGQGGSIILTRIERRHHGRPGIQRLQREQARQCAASHGAGRRT